MHRALADLADELRHLVRRDASIGEPPRAIDVLMVVHQAHYFAYAYALPILFLNVFGLSPTTAYAVLWLRGPAPTGSARACRAH